ncbi:hypothetical protein JCM31826_16720 [Thermaurantimonas aggregans]|uniref:Phosphatidic acid phosphatase type 2/haloperoxidase domain-containing protein n=1 Tax=Thermaurantimonas aggregans TaxID=2173829 RepID=A0A401XME8_9FLAO|nr:hypothetical protein [Thermaurantimonas aggregans]MCX8148387.1 hypothetical protein [Thermaurantimonas aggregans]GCD78190.1 hypothetical protein JCM31826_16720 [Thermaurantimonas aggregans]
MRSTQFNSKYLIAKILSYVLHPAIVPVVFALLFFSINAPLFDRVQKIYILMSIIVGTYFLPITIALLFYKLNILKSLEMHNRQERKAPYIIAAVFYYLTALALKLVPAAQLLHLFLMATSIVILVLLAQIPFYKASAHVASFAGLLAAIIVLSRMYNLSPLVLTLAIAATGIIAWARLEVEAHTSAEVFAGFLSGFTPIFVLFYLFAFK